VTLAAWLETRPSARFVWRSIAVLLALDGLIWAFVCLKRAMPLEKLLLHYDAAWHLAIAERGYFGDAWAFNPLWALVVGAVSRVVPGPLPFVAALLALGLFLAAVRLVVLRPPQAGLAPESRLGWLFFLFAPASYVFHSGHTEALFLFTSLTAFAAAARGHWALAAVLAGLSSLTRFQGVPVAVGVALISAQSAAPGARLGRFLASGMVSFALFALYPLYQYFEVGSPFHAFRTQGKWTKAEDVGDVLEALVLGNAKQPWEYLTRVRHPYYLGFIAASVAMLRRVELRALGVASLLSLAMMLLQGTVSNFFRYTVPLAPTLFFIGDWLARQRLRWQVLVLVPTLYFHLELTYNYAVGRWPY
jgi:hypothetical protein